jgi:hypothetical protein
VGSHHLRPLRPHATYALDFSDNSGAEWLARRLSPHEHRMQLISRRRAEFLHRQGLFVRACRVSSEDNRWADHLSRQRVSVVEDEARHLGLSLQLLPIPPELRTTAWLTSPA